jgi:hypothetical protein
MDENEIIDLIDDIEVQLKKRKTNILSISQTLVSNQLLIAVETFSRVMIIYKGEEPASTQVMKKEVSYAQ